MVAGFVNRCKYARILLRPDDNDCYNHKDNDYADQFDIHRQPGLASDVDIGGGNNAQQGLPAWQPFSIHSEMTPDASLAIALRAMDVGSRPALVLA
jgi:hypothetical protein